MGADSGIERGGGGAIPLLVGVSGHRDPADPEELKARFRGVFERMSRVTDGAATLRLPLLLLTALAEGADQLAAEALLELEAEDKLRHALLAVLPMPLEEYGKDFDGSADDPATPLGRLHHLHGQAAGGVVTLSDFVDPQVRTDAFSAAPGTSNAARDRLYALAGAAVARTPHYLLAAWDGRRAGPGAMAGTAGVASLRLWGTWDTGGRAGMGAEPCDAAADDAGARQLAETLAQFDSDRARLPEPLGEAPERVPGWPGTGPLLWLPTPRAKDGGKPVPQEEQPVAVMAQVVASPPKDSPAIKDGPVKLLLPSHCWVSGLGGKGHDTRPDAQSGDAAAYMTALRAMKVRLAWFNRDTSAIPAKEAAEAGGDPLLVRLCQAFHAANELANGLQKKLRGDSFRRKSLKGRPDPADWKRNSVLCLVVGLGFLAALAFETFAHVATYNNPNWQGVAPLAAPLVYIGLLTVLWWYLDRCRRKTTESRLFDARALAEGLRVQVAWRADGLPVAASERYLPTHVGELAWIRQAMRACILASPGFASPPADKASVLAALPAMGDYDYEQWLKEKPEDRDKVTAGQVWVNGQEKYFKSARQWKHESAETLEGIKAGLAAVAAVVVPVLWVAGYALTRTWGAEASSAPAAVALASVAVMLFVVRGGRGTLTKHVARKRHQHIADRVEPGLARCRPFGTGLLCGLLVAGPGFAAFYWVCSLVGLTNSADHDSAQPHHVQHFMHVWAVTGAVLCAALAGAMHYLLFKTALPEEARTARRWHRVFAASSARLAELGDDPRRAAVLEELGRAALSEHADWLLLHRERPMDMPGH